MSLSKRNSPFANSGIVVGIEPRTGKRRDSMGLLAGCAFQEQIERAAYEAGGGGLRAPATLMKDFVAGRGSSRVPQSSYRPGLTATELDEVVDAAGVRIAAPLRAGLARFAARMPGFLGDDAVLVGVETRTSSPVRVPRNGDTLNHQTFAGCTLPAKAPAMRAASSAPRSTVSALR